MQCVEHLKALRQKDYHLITIFTIVHLAWRYLFPLDSSPCRFLSPIHSCDFTNMFCAYYCVHSTKETEDFAKSYSSDQWVLTPTVSVVPPCFDDFMARYDIHVHTICTQQPCGRKSGRAICPLLDTGLDASCIQVAGLPVCCTGSSRVAMSALATQWKQLL